MTAAIFRRVRPEQVREIALLVIIIVIVVFFATQIPNYLSGRTFTRVGTSVPIIVVVAVGMTMVVLTRNIDLSVGAVVGVVAYEMGDLLSVYPELDPILAVLICIGMGAAFGAFNGLIVAYGGVPAIVATLGTMALYRSLLVVVSGSDPITTPDLPKWLLDLNGIKLLTFEGFDIRVLALAAIVVAVVFGLFLRYATFGRRLYAIGSNPDAASLAGLPVKRDVFVAFVLCGALAGLGGFMWLVRFGNIDTLSATGFELAVVAAVVVGGVNIFGGSGSILGVVLGAILLTLLDQGLIRWAAVSEFLRDALLGLLILLAVASDKVIVERMRAAWVRVRREDEARAADGGPPGAEVTGGG